MLHGIRGVIIDLDGTMLHTAQDLHIAVNRMRAGLGLAPLDLDTAISFVGKGAENLVRKTIGVDFSESEVELRFKEAMALFEQHYFDVNGEFATAYPGVHEGLQEMKRKGLRLACVTNKPIAFTLPLLKKTGLHDYFEIIYGGDSFAKKKPDPMQLLQVCADFGLAPEQIVAIGDSINDSQAARAAGCKVLAVPYGYNHGQAIQDVDSDGIVSSLLEAAHLISS
ncbi:phosphoglycolate phosphatase [Herminiimonas contaminans]|uniref:Phosphoglycolate phosphatase n=1 Tax=Herminiimonas contaminans TaxID=1111140 RepID=A0ABS0EXV4_9BURK|nr:phosphoglycolate phosphatase [Herminiimonas contaminans]MBF8179343.1 phosphoglycolate phosphatase [Herminiimonas contaminans]